MSDLSALRHNTEVIADILIIDDHPTLRRGLIQLLELEDDLKVVGEASGGRQGVELAASLDPDLILVDLNMPEMDGFETIAALRDAGVSSRIIVFSVSEDREDVVKALKTGADGYLLKDMEPEQLVENIRSAANGKMAISHKLTEALAMALQQRDSGSDRPAYDSLTKREKQVLKLIAGGLSNKMIARKLDITEGTVKVHVKRLLHKLHMRSRVEAAVWLTEQKGN
ncbi:two-component system response regulator NarL [Porticoccus sp. W117]|uniref:two-component system response regulator NarL n=1 Tax=Porticoccus sp. W117 TaxID=3054777 RepID=UPI002592D672|nr:two-component system response regulator NarL [Porticoccus sp. W117]MDM3870369.1 two-component system response regulator NarL [Porticoccus sp. W117]